MELNIEEITGINFSELESSDLKVKNVSLITENNVVENVATNINDLKNDKNEGNNNKDEINKVGDKNEQKNEDKNKVEDSKTILIQKNSWTPRNQTYFQICIHRLKYYRIINNFFFFELKKREGRLSWAIIVLSSISSVISLINTEENIFPHSIQIVKWSLVLITLIITLISAYIKKQQFIDRINDIDRYLQRLNQAIAELDVDFIMEPDKRESYDKFCEKYIPLIKNLSLSPASFSPSEWKRTVFIITKYYPELIKGSGENEDLIWPWYSVLDVENLQRIPYNKRRPETEFGKTVLESFKPLDKIKANLLRL